jgi:hypothetical protein
MSATVKHTSLSGQNLDYGLKEFYLNWHQFPAEWLDGLQDEAEQVDSSGPMLWNFLRPQFTNVRSKLECLALAGLSSQK